MSDQAQIEEVNQEVKVLENLEQLVGKSFILYHHLLNTYFL